jgi:o-succinylbenzoate---CoA ligase
VALLCNHRANSINLPMTPSALATRSFWIETTPFAAGNFPGRVPAMPELRGHVLFETSGSSGTPKWIGLSKSALLASAAAVNRHLDVTQDSRWGLALPLHHVGGFGVAARAYEAGCRFVRFDWRWDAVAFAAWLAENEVTHTSLVPTQVHDLVRARVHARASLRAVVVGGGHLDVETGRAARALGWPVLASYGMTEAASQIATQDFSALEHPYQPAPLPLLPIWQTKLTPDERLCIAGPALFSGRLIREGDAWVFQARPSDWHHTEDRASMRDGFLTPLGRADLLVKILGELVNPEAIERELDLLCGGALAPGSFVVVAVPDARREHRLVPVFDSSADADFIHHVLSVHANEAPGLQKLEPAVTLNPFPRSPLGKPLRSEIAAQIAARSCNP